MTRRTRPRYRRPPRPGDAVDALAAARDDRAMSIFVNFPDALAVAAESAGGRLGDTDEYGFMYQRQFDDPDGYHFSPFWADPDAG